MEPESNPNPTERIDGTPEPRRKRLAQACDVCRRKKIKCDGSRPSCSNCLKLNRECTYNPNVKKRGPRQGYIEMLEKRLDKMEKLLSRNGAIDNTEKEGDQPDMSIGSTSGNVGSKIHYNEDSESSEEPRESARKKRHSGQAQRTVVTGNSSMVSQSSASFPSEPPQLFDVSPAEPRPSSSRLPSPDVVNHLLHLFLVNVNYATPLFYKDLLLVDLQKGQCSEFLILCILSVAARFSDRADIREDSPWHSGEKYACKAREMLQEVIDTPTMMNVQGLFLLTLHEYGCARGPRSWMYSGMAVRMALELGLNKEPELEEIDDEPQTAEKWMEQESRRRTFWMIFTIDKFMSATTGRPAILQEEDCDVLMPCNEDGWSKGRFYTESADQSRIVMFNVQSLQNSNLLGVTTSIDNVKDMTGKSAQLGFEGHLIRAIILLGRVTAYVNRSDRAKRGLPPNNPNSEFAILDRQIGGWFDMWPEEYKLQDRDASKGHEKATPFDTRYVTLNIFHSALIVLLHRPSLVLADSLNSDVIQPQLKEFINSSAAKCMKAVDKVTLLMKEIRQDPKLMSPFMTYLTYTIATIIVNNAFSSKLDEAKKARDALSEHFKFLESVRCYWAMADKLYFMIRDLYAMHNNLLRQQMRTMGLLRKKQPTLSEGVTSQDSMRPSEMPTNQSAWLPPLGTSFGSMTTSDGSNPSHTGLPIHQLHYMQDTPNTLLMRSMPLADLSQSTSDGASGTDWFLEGNSHHLSDMDQSMGRIPGQGNHSLFDLSSMLNSGSDLRDSMLFSPSPWTLDFSTSSNMESDQ